MSKSWLKNSSFRPFGDDGDEITIRITETQRKGALGSCDPQSGELRIAPGQAPQQQLVILIHELMHYVEACLMVNGQMKKPINHDFITQGAFGLASALVHSGVIKGITPEAWDSFWADAAAAE